MAAEECHFQTTRWSEIRLARTQDGGRRQDAISALSQRYWQPVYSFLYRKGWNHADALDLTQGFFQEIVLEKDLFQHADESKGRFRYFLLRSLQHYVIRQHRKNTAKKRMPSHRIASLDDLEMEGFVANSSLSSPEQTFQYAWAVTILDRALETLEREYCEDGRDIYWLVFQERVVLPLLENRSPPSLGQLCQTHGIEAEKRVSNMIVTVKRRFQGILRRILSETMEPEGCVEDELVDLIRILGQASAASE